MKKLIRITLSMLTLASIVGLQSCQKVELEANPSGLSDDFSPGLKSQSMNTFYSSTVPVGNGVARAWISVNKNGEPSSVGINLSGKALQDLPDEPKQYVLILPKNKGMNFYTHVLFDWNPQGHEPVGVYDLPHFDFHYYIVPNEDRLAIPPLDPPAFDAAPGADYIPPFYIQLPGLVPEMGSHWVKVTSPELNGSTFTHTFIWGSYEGEYIFWEPMITRDYLLTQPDGIFPISQPGKFQKDGWYATDYKISYSSHPDEYTVALMGLTYHAGQ